MPNPQTIPFNALPDILGRGNLEPGPGAIDHGVKGAVSVSKKVTAILCAVLAAVLYALNMPFSKLLLKEVGPASMASLLYFGAGIGIGLIYLLGGSSRQAGYEKLGCKDIPSTIGMIALDIIAPILLMIGLTSATAANASLLNNFEIVATSLIALIVFKEAVSARLWIAIALITLSSMLLSVEDLSSFQFSYGSLFILAAAVCWGFENNLTRKLSSKNTYQIVTLKGIFSGLGSAIVALIRAERFPPIRFALVTLMLGFVAYGLSIFMYVKAQKDLGAAKTSAYYAIAPFIGALLSLVIIGESISRLYVLALLIMLAGSAISVLDTIVIRHSHPHEHTATGTGDGQEHSHPFTHDHPHTHLGAYQRHAHRHKRS